MAGPYKVVIDRRRPAFFPCHAAARTPFPPWQEHTFWRLPEGCMRMTPDSDTQTRIGRPPLSWRREWDGFQTISPRHRPYSEHRTPAMEGVGGPQRNGVMSSDPAHRSDGNRHRVALGEEAVGGHLPCHQSAGAVARSAPSFRVGLFRGSTLTTVRIDSPAYRTWCAPVQPLDQRIMSSMMRHDDSHQWRTVLRFVRLTTRCSGGMTSPWRCSP